MRMPLLLRLDARDRALFSRLALSDAAAPSSLRLWLAVTHLGGATSAILAVLVPLMLAGGELRHAAELGAWSLALSHLVVQVVKRSIGRPRPTRARLGRSLISMPDRFSFPSGHACAAMAVAFAYGMSMPGLAVPLTLLAVIVGMSRVRLGVHYPGDVLAGEAIAIVTVLGFWTLG
ncbi:MAG: phosphatase PAP2 family protein [Gemmatimonadaceae bacterium]